MERAQEERIQETITMKQAAETRANENLTRIQEKAKFFNERAQNRVMAKRDEERKGRDDLVSLLEDKMSRQSQLKEAALEKARNYNMRVQQKLESYKQGQCEGKESLMFRIEEKLQNASTRRENLIERVKTTAA